MSLKQKSKRDQFIILKEILNVLREPHIVTHIMCTTNLSYKQLKSYLELLIKCGLVEKIESKNHKQKFRITSKGLSFIDLITIDKLVQFTNVSTLEKN